MKKIESTQKLEKAVKDDWSVFMFSADWCPDCRFVEPFLPELEANFPEFTYYYVDRDKFIDTCAEWEIYGIPSFVVFNEGKEVNRFVSKDRKTKEEIEQFLTDSLAKA
ncbi:thioredoxin family protein [Bacillus subtilis]|uniref:thioredoxin family protein n=1 Tax=Bacillus subtilis TaxID=1423 RepID=UPI0011A06536|nr:thioredoxin family protein [Bacillus subtilis]